MDTVVHGFTTLSTTYACSFRCWSPISHPWNIGLLRLWSPIMYVDARPTLYFCWFNLVVFAAQKCSPNNQDNGRTGRLVWWAVLMQNHPPSWKRSLSIYTWKVESLLQMKYSWKRFWTVTSLILLVKSLTQFMGWSVSLKLGIDWSFLFIKYSILHVNLNFCTYHSL